jgi:hypothetical protein
VPRTLRRRATQTAEVHQITGARQGLTDDVRARQARYVVSMGIRTLCLILAAFTPGWWRAVFFAGAVLLPYVAVVLANAGRERTVELPPVAPPSRPELGTGAPPG